MASESKGDATSAPSFDMSAGARYELACFPNRGAAEGVRLLMAHLKVGYSEQRMEFKKWGKYKKNVKLGMLPVLFDDQNCVEVGTPNAIARYIARQHDFYGKTAKDAVQADAVADLVASHNARLAELVYRGPVDTAKVADFMRGNAQVFLATVAKLQDPKSLLFSGAELSFADFLLYDALDVLTQIRSDILKRATGLQRFVAKMAALPSLAAYLASRRPSDFGVEGSHTLPTAYPVCVTGASGYIASHLVQQLLARGYNVVGTVRDPDNEPKVAHLTSLEGAEERLRLVKADLLEEGAFDEAVKGCQVVHHTASPFFVTNITDPEAQLLRPAIEGTLNVLKSCKAAGVKRVVLTSSTAAIYVSSRDPAHLCTEALWTDEAFAAKYEKWYTVSKVRAERAAWKFVEEAGKGCFKLVTMNPTLVVGPALQPRVNTSLSQLMQLARKGDNTMRCLVDVRDVAEAHIRGAEVTSASGRFLLISACMPAKVYSELFWGALPDAEPIVDGNNTKPAVPFFFSCKKAVEELGLTMTPIEKSVADSARSCVARGFMESVFPEMSDHK